MRNSLLVFLHRVSLPGAGRDTDVDFVSERTILSHIVNSVKSLKPRKFFVVSTGEVDLQQGAGVDFIIPDKVSEAFKSTEKELNERMDALDILLFSSDLFPETPELLREFLKYHRQTQNDLTLIGERRRDEFFSEDWYVYSGLALLKIRKSEDWLGRAGFFTPEGQVDVISLVEAADKSGRKIGFKWLTPEEAGQFIVIDKLPEILTAAEVIRKAKVRELLDRGVFILAPDQVWISPEAKVGAGTVIYPFVYIEGNTRLGKNCQVFPHCHIISSRIGNGVRIFDATVIENCRLDDEVQVGPFARLRPETHLRKGSRVGNFVEMKKTRFGRGSKAMHLTYLGDATVGDRVNVGAGTITCNYDGIAKHRTYIGPEAFIGSGTELVAPVKIGRGAYVAAGSTITEDVSPEALAIARARQVEKPGWVRKRKQELSRKSELSRSGK